jgi:hypothetical protein
MRLCALSIPFFFLPQASMGGAAKVLTDLNKMRGKVEISQSRNFLF